jgi:hypothetical protein
MRFSIKNKPSIAGAAVLAVGAALLVFTFLSAYNFLAEDFTVDASEDFARVLGTAFAPIVSACVHVIYLGVMGWVGALLTSRGITLIVSTHKTETPAS